MSQLSDLSVHHRRKSRWLSFSGTFSNTVTFPKWENSQSPPPCSHHTPVLTPSRLLPHCTGLFSWGFEICHDLHIPNSQPCARQAENVWWKIVKIMSVAEEAKSPWCQEDKDCFPKARRRSLESLSYSLPKHQWGSWQHMGLLWWGTISLKTAEHDVDVILVVGAEVGEVFISWI